MVFLQKSYSEAEVIHEGLNYILGISTMTPAQSPSYHHELFKLHGTLGTIHPKLLKETEGKHPKSHY